MISLDIKEDNKQFVRKGLPLGFIYIKYSEVQLLRPYY